MRRGHSGFGGWRNENPRHFRSRSGGNPHFRSSRGYGNTESTRFPPQNSRSARPPYHSHQERYEQDSSEHADRSRHRYNRYSYHRPQQSEKQILPLLPQPRHNSDKHTFKESSAFSKDVRVDNFHINSLGDVDHRQISQIREHIAPPLINPWIAENNIQQPFEGTYNKHHSTEGCEINRLPAEYTGHRPPASDQFGCNPTHSFSAIDNSNTFSRSVDDTVDLIRKRLLNRNEQSSGSFNNNQTNADIDERVEKSNVLPNTQPETSSKRKYQKQNIHSIEKSNCAKIKNKIVHQLFKMDKGKIHKLMDNPNSSTKFEYAISSLITESQNSFNRHLRSAAEKSLCSSSAEFIENDNNTIYEDTFMKQMQCILDPQDTVLLEDIKPIVMAELTKALQLDEYEQKYEIGQDDQYNQRDQNPYNEYSGNDYPYDEYQHNNSYEPEHTQNTNYIQTDNMNNFAGNCENFQDNSEQYKESKPLFNRRERRKSYNFNEESSTISRNTYYGQTHNKSASDENRPEVSQAYFDPHEQFSDEEDPFAELDNQYHVAVDHDFIYQDDDSIPGPVNESSTINSINIKTEYIVKDNNSKSVTEVISNKKQIPYSSIDVKNEPKSPDRKSKSALDGVNNQLKENRLTNKTPDNNVINTDILQLHQDQNNSINNSTEQENCASSVSCTNESRNEKVNSECNEMTKENKIVNESTSVIKSATESNSRKRSIDQRPSHRKEKRKKVEMCQSETNKQILNKNIIINVNDCASKASEKCEAPKSVFNLFFSKGESKTTSKDNKKFSSNDKNYTEKHVKRKETPKKICGKDTKSRKDSISSQPSPNEKQEAKTTLKSIDMFTEKPKKVNIHQAHRNTAQASSVVSKVVTGNISKVKEPISREVTKKHVAVQVLRKFHSKEIQTDTKKFAVKAIQTDLVPDRPGTKATDTFERMKEIDLEIQVLLQEKFKLYSSLENKEAGNSSMQTLGMTVLNVDQFDGVENGSTADILHEDAIVDDFTNIPVEELEQIAFESVEETPKVDRRSRRRKVSHQESVHSNSSTSIGQRRTRRTKSPNISLIEQIITDDRPLEDIISLDDLEVAQTLTKSKAQKSKKTVKKKLNGKAKAAQPVSNLNLKPCSVVLIRADLSDYLPLHTSEEAHESESLLPLNTVPEESEEIIKSKIVHETEIVCDNIEQFENNVVVESIDNDIQFDMLDVSEDIVVGDNCEVKSSETEDKEMVECIPVPISEEIILDNSQSSMEDVTTPAACQGGECKMYDYSSDENLRRDSVVVTGNGDAVLAVECVENNFLAASLDGNVYYFSGEGQLITTLRGSNLAVTCLTIVKEKYGTTVYTGSLDSRIRYYDLETGLEKGPECNVLSPIQTMDRAWDTVFVGTRTGFVLQFECKNNMLIPVSSVKFSDQSILALRAMKEGPRKVLLVAARSENVTIKDAQTGLLLRTLAGPKMTVYTLLYEDGKVYCGTSSHQIHVFDYTSGSHVGSHEGGKGAVCLRATGGLLFAGCYDGCIYVYREGESQPFAQIRGPSLMLLSLAVVGSKIIAGYKDRSLYIWKIPLCILQEMIL